MRWLQTPLLGLILLSFGTPLFGQMPGELRDLLRRHPGFSDAELASLTSGRILSRSLELDDPRDMAIVVVSHPALEAAAVVQRFREIERFAQTEVVAEVGKFGDPAEIEDLSGLAIPAEDLRDLRTCAPGACDVKLSEDWILKIRKGLDESGAGAEESADHRFRRMLVELVASYRSTGIRALPRYADKPQRLSVAEGLETLLNQSPYLDRLAPGFRSHLRQYPDQALEGAEEFIYWSKETFGLKPVVRVQHATIYWRQEDGQRRDRARAVIGQVGLYASHYLQATFVILAVWPDPADNARSFVAYIHRARFDGPVTGLRRRLLETGLQENLEERLGLLEDPASNEDG